MVSTARKKGANLERKLYELNDQANQTKIAGAEKLYSLLVYLHDKKGLESRLFEDEAKTEFGVIYMLEDHLEHCFDENSNQIAPISMLVQLERAHDLIDIINKHGGFTAEMKEWNSTSYQAHLIIHPTL